ncbi:amidohydrolase [Nocardioides sp. NPDC023903]|uniref:amidohydrolase n=1 Tax=Nocardioides sp. NPDC023903 TaxID=3157195 RepID=UPI0033C115AF
MRFADASSGSRRRCPRARRRGPETMPQHTDTLDLVLTGSFWTPALERPETGGIAVKDGVIVEVARTPSAIANLVESAHEVIPLGDGIVVPGLQDAHVHPVFAALQLRSCELTELATADEFLTAIARYAHAHPERDWVTGGGWTFNAFPPSGPHRRDLDRICPYRPVALTVRDVHAMWVNSEALRRAGVTDATPDPPGGRIERDANGQPTGVLHEQAMALIHSAIPAPTTAELDSALCEGQRVLHANGITAWQDALIGSFGGNPDVYESYVRAAQRGTLTGRVNGALFWDPGSGLAQLDGLRERRDAARIGRFTARAIKIMQDGIPENHTAAMHAPYLDENGTPTETTGGSLLDPEALTATVAELDAAGFDLHFHAMGDRALTEVLDALQHRPGAPDARHQIAHLQSVAPGDIPRLRQVGATANIQAYWAAHEEQMDHICIPLLGPERADQQFPFAELRRAGTRLAAGSDWPVSTPSPLSAIHVAVNRVLPGRTADHPVFIERQRLSVHDALTAYTAGGAWVNRLDRTGAIRPGFLADFTILDADPFAVPADQIHEIAPIATVIAGETVWAAEDCTGGEPLSGGSAGHSPSSRL